MLNKVIDKNIEEITKTTPIGQMCVVELLALRNRIREKTAQFKELNPDHPMFKTIKLSRWERIRHKIRGY